MISCTEFIWVYAELFRFLEERGGDELPIKFWKGVSDNFLGNLRDYVEKEGLAGHKAGGAIFDQFGGPAAAGHDDGRRRSEQDNSCQKAAAP